MTCRTLLTLLSLATFAVLPLPAAEPHVLFSPRQDAVIWPLEEL